MRVHIVFFSVVLFLFSCNRLGGAKKKTVVGLSNYERIEKRIAVLEDTLHYAYRELMANRMDTMPINTIHLLESYYQRAFKLAKTKTTTFEYLDRLQQLYLQEKKYALSISWTDSLLLYAPKYKQKASLLLNAATTSEVFLKDRRKSIYYYNRLLNEHPKLKMDVVKMVKSRLENLNKS